MKGMFIIIIMLSFGLFISTFLLGLPDSIGISLKTLTWSLFLLTISVASLIKLMKGL